MTRETNAPTDADLDRMLEASERLLAAHVKSGGKPETFQLRLIHRKRRTDAQKAKASQPKLAITESVPAEKREEWLKTLRDEFRKPMTEEERTQAASGHDQLALSFQEALDSGDLEDAIHAAFRIARKVHCGCFGYRGVDPDPARWSPEVKQQLGVE